MPTHFVCLANSLKEGGRCLAGIELDDLDRPVFLKGRPKWIRPICNTEHGEIPIHIAVPFDLLDIIEVDIIDLQPAGFQSENVRFHQNTIQKVGTFSQSDLAGLCDNRATIFGNRGKAVSQDSIGDLDHSLVLLLVNHFKVFEKTYTDRPGKSQLRISFEYNETTYDLPITDPMFRDNFNNNKNFSIDLNQIYLCVSLGIMWEGWYYKLVAGIIY